MCASSPGLGQRSSPKLPASVKTSTLKSKETQTALSLFKQILQSCYGPTGHPKIIQNKDGGYMTTTSTSCSLLQNLTVSKPVLKLMVAAIQGHLSRFSDGGLFCGLLMANLVDSCAELGFHPVLCINVNEHLLQKSLKHIDSIKIPVDVADMRTLNHILHSVMQTKPACLLTQSDIECISTVVLKAFLKSIPDSKDTNAVSHVTILGVEGYPLNDSCVLDGLYLEAINFTSNVENYKVLHGSQIRVALYSISMSGDSENFTDVSYELLTDVNPQDAVIAQMMVVARKLIADGVGLIFCQKVIHPTLKKFFRENGVKTLDRLSGIHIAAVQKVTGAQILSSFTPNISTDAYGYLTSFEIVQLFAKKYLHLENLNHSVCTMILCHRTSAALDEMKFVCSAAKQTLGLILTNPLVLPGAGCSEMYIASKLRHDITTVDRQILEELGCSRAQYLTISKNFAACIESIVSAIEHDGGRHISDSASHHCFRIPPGVTQDSDWLNNHTNCACGMKTYEEISAVKVDAQTENTEADVQTGSTEVAVQTGSTDCNSREHFVLQNDTEGETARKDCPKVESRGNRASKQAMVMDCYTVRCNALCVAVETANMILRIRYTIEDQN